MCVQIPVAVHAVSIEDKYSRRSIRMWTVTARVMLLSSSASSTNEGLCIVVVVVVDSHI